MSAPKADRSAELEHQLGALLRQYPLNTVLLTISHVVYLAASWVLGKDLESGAPYQGRGDANRIRKMIGELSERSFIPLAASAPEADRLVPGAGVGAKSPRRPSQDDALDHAMLERAILDLLPEMEGNITGLRVAELLPEEARPERWSDIDLALATLSIRGYLDRSFSPVSVTYRITNKRVSSISVGALASDARQLVSDVWDRKPPATIEHVARVALLPHDAVFRLSWDGEGDEGKVIDADFAVGVRRPTRAEWAAFLAAGVTKEESPVDGFQEDSESANGKQFGSSPDDWCGEPAPRDADGDHGHCTLVKGHDRHDNGHDVEWRVLRGETHRYGVSRALAELHWPDYLGQAGERVLRLAAQGFDGCGRRDAAKRALEMAATCRDDAEGMRLLRENFRWNERADLPFPIREVLGFDADGNDGGKRVERLLPGQPEWIKRVSDLWLEKCGNSMATVQIDPIFWIPGSKTAICLGADCTPLRWRELTPEQLVEAVYGDALRFLAEHRGLARNTYLCARCEAPLAPGGHCSRRISGPCQGGQGDGRRVVEWEDTVIAAPVKLEPKPEETVRADGISVNDQGLLVRDIDDTEIPCSAEKSVTLALCVLERQGLNHTVIECLWRGVEDNAVRSLKRFRSMASAKSVGAVGSELPFSFCSLAFVIGAVVTEIQDTPYAERVPHFNEALDALCRLWIYRRAKEKGRAT